MNEFNMATDYDSSARLQALHNEVRSRQSRSLKPPSESSLLSSSSSQMSAMVVEATSESSAFKINHDGSSANFSGSSL
jgi:hypothetical protein